jgi:RNA polymerase sigma-70 factor (ECF subfamily)
MKSVALNAEEAAYEAVIQQFEHPVFNFVSQLVDDPSDAVDVVQDVFLEVFRNIAILRDETTLKTWVYRIAVNEARKRRRRRPPVKAMGALETRTPVEEALNSLNLKLRIPLVLREMEGLSCEKIAEILGVSACTVSSRLLRGWDALKEHLAGRLDPASVPEAAAFAAIEFL